MKSKQRFYLFLGVLLVAIAFIAVGIVLGQPTRVWQKAVLICFECIGLG